MTGRRTVVAGRLVLSTTRQAPGHPVVDRAIGYVDGRQYRAVAIRPALSPMRDRTGGMALVVGWLR